MPLLHHPLTTSAVVTKKTNAGGDHTLSLECYLTLNQIIHLCIPPSQSVLDRTRPDWTYQIYQTSLVFGSVRSGSEFKVSKTISIFESLYAMRFSKVRFGKFGIYPVRSTTDLSAHQHLEAKHLCLSNNISVKPLPQSF